MSPSSFSSLNLCEAMLANLDILGYKKMTPVQQETLPLILDGKDVLAQAKTGSGKTAAFGIGLLAKLDVKKFRVQSLVLCPTRELADQVAKELRLIARFAHNIKVLTLCGGVAFGPQFGSLKHGAHIVVGTPGRVLKHLKKGSLQLDDLECLVLDEADRMLDMGFIEEIEGILSFTPAKRQTLLFSATYPEEIISLSSSIQSDAHTIVTLNKEQVNDITEYFCEVEDDTKFDTLLKVLSHFHPQTTILFCNTKVECDMLSKDLRQSGVDALALHGDMQQYERNDVLVQFANGSCSVLVATDVAARGLDIKELELVLNYDLPHLQETYVHRIGRTGRAGAVGRAVTFYERSRADELEEYAKEGAVFDGCKEFALKENFSLQPHYVTLVIEGGKKEKLRAGDLLGALTGDVGLQGDVIGKIDIYERQSYVAIKREFIKVAQEKLSKSKIKKKKFSIWILE